MTTPDQRHPDDPPDPRSQEGSRERPRAAEPELARYHETLRRSLAEIDAALESNLPAVGPDGVDAGDAAGSTAASAGGAEGPADDGEGRTPEAAASSASGEWDRPAVLPYLTATLLAVTAMVVLVLSTTLPAAGVFQIGLTFLAVAMVVRRLEDAPRDSDNPVVAWLHDRAVQLEGKFGVEFYGVAALTSFLRAEVDLVTGISIDGFLSNPIGAAIVWFVSALVESILNAVWASLWWFQLMQEVEGLPLLAGIIAAGWVVWRVLDITPAPEDG